VLDRNLSRCLIQRCIGLDEDLARLLVLENNVTDLLAPEFSVNRCHVHVKVSTSLDIGGRFVNVQLLEILGDSWRIC